MTFDRHRSGWERLPDVRSRRVECARLDPGSAVIQYSRERSRPLPPVRGTLVSAHGTVGASTVSLVFAGHEVTVDAPFETAAARLVNLLHRDALSSACEGAYEGGLAAELRVGPFGAAPGLSKLVRVCFAEPVRRSATMTVPLRWEAAGAAGELFPVLDADLVLARHGEGQSLVALMGSYRPPFGRAGAVLDKAIMHRLAAATIRSLLERLSDAIAHPAPHHQPAPEAGAPGPRPAIEPEEP